MGAIDGGNELGKLARRVRQLETQSGSGGSGFGSGGDSSHPGSGTGSLLLGGDLAEASGDYSIGFGAGCNASGFASIAFGRFTVASGSRSVAIGEGSDALANFATALAGTVFSGGINGTALGYGSAVLHDGSTAVGKSASTTAANQIRLGTAVNTTSVPGNLTVDGVFSNPSARHLKTNIEPVCLRDVFPPLYEYEYLARMGERRIGHMVDDLVGTDAERFVTFDEDGEPAGIDYLGLHGAQIAALRAENEDLRGRLATLEDIVRGLTNG
jgi:hypothetical protein